MSHAMLLHYHPDLLVQSFQQFIDDPTLVEKANFPTSFVDEGGVFRLNIELLQENP